jgi:hypothetical protein
MKLQEQIRRILKEETSIFGHNYDDILNNISSRDTGLMYVDPEEFIKQKHLTRNITYFILENNLLDIDITDIMSENIENILNSLLDDDIDNIIDKIYELNNN